MDIKKITGLGLGVLVLSVAANAFAIASGPYVGFQGGISNTNNKSKIIATGGDPEAIKITPSSTGFGGRLFGGYNINPYFALEMGITHYANATYKTNIPGKCNDPQIHENSLDFLGKGSLPFGDAFDVFVKVGGAAIRQTTAGSLLPTSTSLCNGSNATTTTVRPEAAIGASYYLSQNWVADLSYSQVFGNSNVQNASLLALGISYHFVDKYCGQFLC